MEKGKLIFFEGVDGCGKTDQWHKAINSTSAWGSAQPNDTDYIQMIKEAVDVVEQAMLYAGDRRREMHYVSRLLNEGQHVISDRGPLSMMAYQGTELERVQFWNLLEDLNKWAMEKVETTATIIFHAPLDVCINRVDYRQCGTLSQEAIDDMTRAHAYYERISAPGYTDPHQRLPWLGQVYRVDSNRPADDIHADVMKILEPLIGAK